MIVKKPVWNISMQLWRDDCEGTREEFVLAEALCRLLLSMHCWSKIWHEMYVSAETPFWEYSYWT
jgi:hypothetical protein